MDEDTATVCAAYKAVQRVKSDHGPENETCEGPGWLCRAADPGRGSGHDAGAGRRLCAPPVFRQAGPVSAHKKVLQAQRAECAAAPAVPSISILTPLYNTPEKYLREFLDSL